MSRRKFDATERIGMNVVADIVTIGLGWIWREQFAADFGVDGQIEAIDQEGKPTGQLFAVQVKAGRSYFRGSGEAIPFYIDEEHLKYWDQHALPVVLVLHNPDDQQTLWQWADLKSARTTRKGWCIDVPRAKKFDAKSKAELQDQVWTDDSAGLRRRFAIDRQLMKEFDGRDAFVAITKWINKSLQYREIEIRFDEPDKQSPDLAIPILASWHYEVSDLMRHFLPWLEYEYHVEPYESAGEVEGHELAVWLSKPAKAYLEAEAFFFFSSQPAEPEETDPDIPDDDWYDAHSLGEP